jgi:DNA-binding SARP family transcriptional activator
MTEAQPTIEELQAQILELKEQNETNATKLKELEGTNAKLNEDLGSARSLNAKLMRNLPAGGEEGKKKEEPEQETQEQFFDSFIKPAIENLGKR